MAGLLGLLGLGGQQPMQAQTSGQPQSRGLLSNISDPLVALPLAGALMQPGGFGQNLGQGFAGAGAGMAIRNKLQRDELGDNATAKWLESQGADTGLIELAKSGQGGLALQQWNASKKDPLDELRLKTAQLQYDKLSNPSAADTEYGLTPQTGVDENGNPVLIQLGKNGKSIRTPLPEGVTISKAPIKLDAGTEFILLDPITRQPVGRVPKDLAGAAAQTKIGQGQGEATVAYNSMASKMPGLEAVVKKLDDLSEKATYTLGGQIYNAGRTQIGMGPSEGAKARTEYISTVDNQILPLLRDTFGAAFTQKEGDSLRSTLGDPDKSPQEKQLVLKSFIEQKRRDVEAMASQANGVPSPQGDGNNDPLGIR